jgi:hypothetical protein
MDGRRRGPLPVRGRGLLRGHGLRVPVAGAAVPGLAAVAEAGRVHRQQPLVSRDLRHPPRPVDRRPRAARALRRRPAVERLPRRRPAGRCAARQRQAQRGGRRRADLFPDGVYCNYTQPRKSQYPSSVLHMQDHRPN